METGKTGNFKGVSYDKRTKMWKSNLRHNKISYLNNLYATEKEAAKVRDLVIIKHNLPLPLQVLTKIENTCRKKKSS